MIPYTTCTDAGAGLRLFMQPLAILGFQGMSIQIHPTETPNHLAKWQLGAEESFRMRRLDMGF